MTRTPGQPSTTASKCSQKSYLVCMTGAMFLLVAGAAAAMTLPHLPAASELAGAWTLEEPGNPAGACTIRLHARAVSVGHAIDLPDRCRAAFGLQEVAAWRPVPLGLAFAREDRLTVAAFEQESRGAWVARRRDAPPLVLRRAPPPSRS